MTIEDLTNEYRKIYIDDYRKSHPEETRNLTDEEIAPCVPLTGIDREIIKYQMEMIYRAKVNSILRKINDLSEEIKDDTKTIETCNNSQFTTELRQDIRDNTLAISFFNETLKEAQMKLKEIEDIEIDHEYGGR